MGVLSRCSSSAAAAVCILGLIFGLAASQEVSTDDKPLILNEETSETTPPLNPEVSTDDKPLILNEETSETTPLLNPEVSTDDKPLILNEETAETTPLLNPEVSTDDKPLILNEETAEITPPLNPEVSTDDKPLILNEETAEITPLLNPLDGFENVNPTQIRGDNLYQGDILLSAEQKKDILNRKAIRHTYRRWDNGPNGVPLIPYKFGDNNVDQPAVRDGIAHWEEHTCIRFQETSQNPSNCMVFIRDSGCWSYVGKQSSPQSISIGNGCTSLGVVVHEIGHALGFFHEQSRSDRDDYVKIHLENVQSGRENNFRKENDNNYSVPYDFNSIMHYGSAYFTMNGKNTISTKNPLAQGLVGNRDGLTHYDKLLANTMYPCISTWLAGCSLTSDPCLNDGYTGEDCNCVCPRGTSGSTCESVDEDYYASLLGDCTEKITTPGTITSPNYPSRYDVGVKCTKWIVAPECNTVKITFNAFRLYGYDNYCAGNACCYFDYLEIRTTDLSMGDLYCDTDIAAGTEFTSPSNELILYFKTATNYYSGWSADVTFEPIPGCAGPVTESPSTTTSSTSTSTTSTATTTTPSFACSIMDMGSNKMQWTSPNFGNGKYPNGESCSITPKSDSPMWAEVKVSKLQLHKSDKVMLESPSSSVLLKGKKTGTYKMSSFNLNGEFYNSQSKTGLGFQLTIQGKSSNCHKLINANAGAAGKISTPKKANNAWMKKACEYWIRSPPGTQIKLTFTKMKMKSQCKQNKLTVDKAGDVTYPSSTSMDFCQSKPPSPITSVGNEMNIMFFTKKGSSGFMAKYQVI